MKLENIRISGFRGFNLVQEFGFSKGLNAAYGPNGLGKTSLAESLEWLFFGGTSKLLFARSKLEFRNSLRNLHYPTLDVAYVEADIILEDMSRHTIRRELLSDEKSNVFLNGTQCQNFQSLGISIQSPMPVIAQHGLKEFINSEPSKRWESISKMLGLELISGFRNALTTSITQFNNANASFSTSLADIVKALRGKPFFAELERSLEEFNIEAFRIELNKLTAQLMGNLPDEPLLALKAEREGMTTLLSALPQSYLQAASTEPGTMEAPAKILKEVVESIESYATTFPSYVAACETKGILERITFLKQGMQLSEKDKPTCPFCGEPTVTPEKKSSLEKEVDDYDSTHKLYLISKQNMELLKQKVPQLQHVLRKVVPPRIQIETFQDLLTDLTDQMQQELMTSITLITEVNAKFETWEKGTSATLNDLIQGFDRQIFEINHFTSLVVQIAETTEIIEVSQLQREKALLIQAKITPYLLKKAAENEKIELIDLLTRIWSNILVIEKGFSIHQIGQRMLNLKKATEAHEKSLTTDTHYEFISYGVFGPEVAERAATIAEYIKEASKLKKGGFEQREIALHLMRKSLERLCKEAYTKETGKQLPKRYESLSSSQLKELVREISLARDLGKVNFLLTFGDPASHDGSKIEISEAMVDSMIDQMVNLIKSYLDPNFKRP
nr:AAA family ATPase [Paenibacillus sp. MMS18-CY102]